MEGSLRGGLGNMRRDSLRSESKGLELVCA